MIAGMTVGELRGYIKDLPDDAEVYYQRIEDVYFNIHHWKAIEKPDVDAFNHSGFYVRAQTVNWYKDGNLYITAHY